MLLLWYNATMNADIPVSIEKLLWDADLRSLDTEAHRQLITERVINYGTLADWRWLVARYGAENVRSSLWTQGVFSRNVIRSEAQQLALLIIQ